MATDAFGNPLETPEKPRSADQPPSEQTPPAKQSLSDEFMTGGTKSFAIFCVLLLVGVPFAVGVALLGGDGNAILYSTGLPLFIVLLVLGIRRGSSK
jgi:hypothetical protein